LTVFGNRRDLFGAQSRFIAAGLTTPAAALRRLDK